MSNSRIDNWIMQPQKKFWNDVEDAEMYIQASGEEGAIVNKALHEKCRALLNAVEFMELQDQQMRKWKSAFNNMFSKISDEDEKWIDYAIDKIVKDAKDILKVLQATEKWAREKGFLENFPIILIGQLRHLLDNGFSDDTRFNGWPGFDDWFKELKNDEKVVLRVPKDGKYIIESEDGSVVQELKEGEIIDVKIKEEKELKDACDQVVNALTTGDGLTIA